ncbi:MAG: hypothetical protein V8Q36_05770 [Anaerotignum sp.]
MSRFLSARFAGLEAYTPGEQPQDMQYVKLNTNESPYPPSPEVFARINGEEIGKLQLYPDPEGKNSAASWLTFIGSQRKIFSFPMALMIF